MPPTAWIYLDVIYCFLLSGCNSTPEGARRPKAGPETGEARIVNIISLFRYADLRA